MIGEQTTRVFDGNAFKNRPAAAGLSKITTGGKNGLKKHNSQIWPPFFIIIFSSIQVDSLECSFGTSPLREEYGESCKNLIGWI